MKLLEYISANIQAVVNSRRRNGADDLLYPNVTEFGPLGLQVLRHVPQAFAAGKLADQHGHELQQRLKDRN
jgi:hypothetical protein